jgi:hypothetical protein
MKKADVVIGQFYTAKVSGRITRIRILSESRFGGWNARNTWTGRDVRVKTAARLRAAIPAVREAVLAPGTCPAIAAGPSEAEAALMAEPEILCGGHVTRFDETKDVRVTVPGCGCGKEAAK